MRGSDLRTTPPTLDYAVAEQAGDDIAYRMLVRVLSVWLIVRLLWCVVDIAIVLIFFSAGWLTPNWSITLNALVVTVECILLWRCFLMIREKIAFDQRIAVAAIIVEIVPAFVSVSLFVGAPIQQVQSISILCAYHFLRSCPLVMILLLRNRGAHQWLNRMTWLVCAISICLLAAWLWSAALELVERTTARQGSSSVMPEPVAEWVKRNWKEIGLVVGTIGLVLLRREGNRILIRLLGAWIAMFLGHTLYNQHIQSWIYYRFRPWDLYTFLADMTRFASAAIPIAFLVWFTFRFTDAQRRAMGSISRETVESPG